MQRSVPVRKVGGWLTPDPRRVNGAGADPAMDVATELSDEADLESAAGVAETAENSIGPTVVPRGGAAHKVLSGTRWMTGGNIGVQILRLLTSLALARLLAPQDFGVLAMATIVTAFLDIFKDLGTGSALIQRREVDDDLISSVFFLNIGIGVVLTGVMAISAPIIANFYGTPRAAPVLAVMSFALVISAAGIVHQALLRRQMQFGRLASVNVSNVVVNGLVAIPLAALGRGQWALVIGLLCASMTSTVGAWMSTGWRPHLHFAWSDVAKVSSFGLNLTGFNIANFFLLNADKVLVGRFLGPVDLGYYILAQRLLAYPVASLSSVINEVLFPAFSRFQDDNALLRKGYTRAACGVALIGLPVMCGVATLASPLVDVLLGSKWHPVVPLFVALAPVGALQAILTTITTIYYSKGRTDWLLWWGLSSGSCVVIGYVVGLHWHLIGVAVSYPITIGLLTFPSLYFPIKLIGLRMRDLLRSLEPFVTATALMALAAVGVRLLCEYLRFGSPSTLAVAIPAAAVVYAAAVLVRRTPAVADLQQLVLARG